MLAAMGTEANRNGPYPHGADSPDQASTLHSPGAASGLTPVSVNKVLLKHDGPWMLPHCNGRPDATAAKSKIHTLWPFVVKVLTPVRTST